VPSFGRDLTTAVKNAIRRTETPPGRTTNRRNPPAKRLVAGTDRREELARLCLRALGLRPAGETAAQAEDRLATLNSVERRRVLHEVKSVPVPPAPTEVPTRPPASETAAAPWVTASWTGTSEGVKPWRATRTAFGTMGLSGKLRILLTPARTKGCAA
jgi:hypothetical protein